MKEKKILIVDFDNETSENLSKYLSGEGFEVSIAKDGQSGQEKFQSERPDLIVLEPMLPKVHGFDLCKNLFQNAGRKIPIVFTTEFYGEEQCKREATHSGEDMAFFKKPYNSHEVLSSILDLLGNGAKEKAEGQTKVSEGSKTTTQAAEAADAPLEPEQSEAPPTGLKNQPPDSPPATEAELTEKQKKQQLPEDIDKMLKDTLTEFGMGVGVDKAEPTSDTSPAEPTPQPQDTPLPQEQERAKVEHEVEEEDTEKKSTAAVEPTAAIETPEKGEKRPDLIQEIDSKQDLEDTSKQGIFKGFAEEKGVDRKTLSEKFMVVLALVKKKPALKYILPLVLVGLIAAGSALVFLQPNKGDTTPVRKVSQSSPASAKNSEGVQLADLSAALFPTPGETQDEKTPGAADSPNTSDEQNQTNPGTSPPETQSNAEIETPASSEKETPPPTNPPPPTTLSPEYTEPVLPDASVYQEIDINPEIKAKTDQLGTVQKSALTGEANLSEEANKNINPSTPQANLPQTQPGDIVALTMVDTPPILIKRVPPRYPLAAMTQDSEESVTVNVLISENGEVEKTVVLKGGIPELGYDKATIKAVSQWRFKPAVKDGVKVKVWKPFKIVFKKNK